MGEAKLRMVSDVCGIHHHNPNVPHSDARIGGGHRHDMTPWHSLNTGYSMATLGPVDYYYFTGDERMNDILALYGLRCAEDKIGFGYGSGHFAASLVRIWEAVGNPEFKEKAVAKMTNDAVRNAALKPGFRTPTDLWPHLIFQEQIMESKETADLLLQVADGKGPMMHQIKAWAYLRTKDPKFLEWCRGSLTWQHWEKNIPHCAKLKDPWTMNWQELRQAMNFMPSWHVKIYINAQQVGRFPAYMRALAEGENVVLP